MANKRMFNMKIVDSDAFLDMPLSAQCLYFHLNMRADDDGFVGNPKKIMRIVGASEDDLKLLIAKRFLLTFENGVIVIKHWRMHNTLSGQRYHETVYKDEKEMLYLKDNKAYSFSSGSKIDDTNLIEMFDDKKLQHKVTEDNKQTENKRRTFGEQAENADIEVVVEEVLDIDIEKGISNKSLNSSSAVQSKDPEAVFINIPLKDGKVYSVTYAFMDEMKELYPDVDIPQCFRNMVGWTKSKPDRMKTQRGIKSFINNWLQKDQKEASEKKTTGINRLTGNSKQSQMELARQRAIARDMQRGEMTDE